MRASAAINLSATAGLLLSTLLLGGCLMDSGNSQKTEAKQDGKAGTKTEDKQDPSKSSPTDPKSGGLKAAPLGKSDVAPIPTLKPKSISTSKIKQNQDKQKQNKPKDFKMPSPTHTPELAMAQSLFQHPPLNNADSPEFRKMVQYSKNLQADADRLRTLQQTPDPQAKPYLLTLSASDLNPLAPAATSQLADYPGEDTEKHLHNLLENRSPQVRSAALASLTVLNAEEGAKQAESLLSDPDAGVRTSAALALGLTQSGQATGKLNAMLAKNQPGVAIMVAWALLRCAPAGSADHDHAVQYLKEISRSDSARFAAQAVTMLRSETSREIVGFLYESLYNRWDTVMLAAADSLNQVEPRHREAALEGFSAERKLVLSQRLASLLYFMNKGPAPEQYNELLTSADLRDRQLALDCVARDLRVKDLPELIELIGDPTKSIREKAVALLREAVQKYGMSAGPDDGFDQVGWCRWWLRQYRVLSAIEGRAIVRSPDGAVRQVAAGFRLDFRAQVIKIRPGLPPDGREGARVELLMGTAPILLDP